MSTHSAQSLHNRDPFSKYSYYSKNFHWASESQEETAEQEPHCCCWKQSVWKETCTSHQHRSTSWVTFESSPSGPGACASMYTHTLQPSALLPRSTAFLKSILGLHSNGIYILCFAHCMFIAAGLIRTGCSCPWRHQPSKGTCVCREVTTPKPACNSCPRK